jgi:ATP-dependent DNA helicase RecQ
LSISIMISAFVPVIDELLPILRRTWGYEGFRPLQREAMAAVLERRDSVVVLPTGGGKSVCFQAPALAAACPPGVGLVVSPLIALMKDQVDALRANGVAAAALHSALAPEERDRQRAELRAGRLRLLYVSPERLVGEGSEGFLRLLGEVGIAYLAIDEAHCISQWGHDFRPEYRRLAALRETFPETAVHAFTATATPRVRRDIVEQLRLRGPEILVGSFDRPNLVYRVLRRAGLQRQILDVVERHRGEGGIVYCITRRETEELAAALVAQGVRAAPYHAGLPDAVRHEHQDAFLDERLDVVVATVAFGMGIDRSNLRFVVHAGAPRSLEHYQQESGRAGRDGLESECVLVWSPADMVTWRRLTAHEDPEVLAAALEHLRGIERFAASTTCRHRALVEYFGQRYEPPPGRGDCGACDRCLGELVLAEEPVVLAQKILSCVLRTRESYGAGHVIDVLRGKVTDRVAARGHQELSTFGLLADLSVEELRGYVEQLLERGALATHGDRYPMLRVTAEGRLLLKGQAAEGFELVHHHRPPKKDKVRLALPVGDGWEGVDSALFESLRAERLAIARERGVPPYVVFHDTTLRELARRRPRTVDEMRQVHGIGRAKAESFGERFLAVLRRAGSAAG